CCSAGGRSPISRRCSRPRASPRFRRPEPPPRMTEAVLVLGVERSDRAPASRTAPTTVLLVRHGLTPTTGKLLPGRSAGLHLSDEGQPQGAAAARTRSPIERVAAIYSSPLERA